jgi:hypothetical protein
MNVCLFNLLEIKMTKHQVATNIIISQSFLIILINLFYENKYYA